MSGPRLQEQRTQLTRTSRFRIGITVASLVHTDILPPADTCDLNATEYSWAKINPLMPLTSKVAFYIFIQQK